MVLAELKRPPNRITGPNAGGPHQSPIRTRWIARVGQFTVGRCVCQLWRMEVGFTSTGRVYFTAD